jgi:predicted transport protein
MPIFAINRGKLTEISEVPIEKEKDIHKQTESNLDAIFGLHHVTTEFELNGLRVDTLTFDKESRSFVIIEYKRDRNFSIIDQGYAYLALLLNNKAEFILAFNERMDYVLKKGDVDWSQSKVIFIAPSFTNYQRQAIGFQDLPIELWEVKKYANGTILFNQIESPEKSESVTKISQKSDIVKSVSREVKTVTEEMHMEMGDENIRSLYKELKDAVLTFASDVTIKPKAKYIAFKRKTNFFDVAVYRSQLNLFINMGKGTLNDPKGMAEDVSTKGHWGNGDYVIKLKEAKDLGYVLSLIRQSYEKN